MTMFSIIFLIALAAALIYFNHVENKLKLLIESSPHKSDLFKRSLLEQIKGFKMAKYGVITIAVVVISLALIKQILITAFILVLAGILLSISSKRFNTARQLSRLNENL